eukprot:COSAG04_NODE_4867_length_1853_cov_1.258837_1_plen_305_part_01
MPKKKKAKAKAGCDVQDIARRYLESIGLHGAYFDSKYDRCYCEDCWKGPDTIAEDGPTPYVVPRGWVRFGLVVHPGRAEAHNIFDKWSVSFHGVKDLDTLRSILDCGQLMKSGDVLLDGSVLRSAKCARRQEKQFYTSPTVRYAGLKIYAEPQPVDGQTSASIVLQCRQRPGSFETQGETLAFDCERQGTSGPWPGHLAHECPHVELDDIEWKSKINVAAIPYGLLIRVYDLSQEISVRSQYSSPVDKTCGWWKAEEKARKKREAAAVAAEKKREAQRKKEAEAEKERKKNERLQQEKREREEAQ